MGALSLRGTSLKDEGIFRKSGCPLITTSRRVCGHLIPRELERLALPLVQAFTPLRWTWESVQRRNVDDYNKLENYFKVIMIVALILSN